MLSTPTPPRQVPAFDGVPGLASLIALALALGLTACSSPGMKLDARPDGKGGATKMGDLKVTLQPLDPATLQALASRKAAVDPLQELMSEGIPAYQVGPQDVLLVTVWDHPEITLPLGEYRTDAATGMVVDEQGFLYFPYLGKVQVAGMTTSQVREMLIAQLDKVIQRPQVDVKVIAFRSQKVYIGGEVKTPGVFTVTDVPFTLAEAVNRAGGFLPTADDSRILLTRGNQTWRLDFHALLATGNRIGKILLKPGDSLHVPNANEEPVYLLGELQRPGILPLIHGKLSLAQALTEAGGILGTSADARSIYVIRQGGAPDAVDVFHLDARNPTAMVMADRFALNPRDVIYVDAGSLVRFNRVMSLVLPTVATITQASLAANEIRYLRTR
jgi:polysaccharide export outer membrane protein